MSKFIAKKLKRLINEQRKLEKELDSKNPIFTLLFCNDDVNANPFVIKIRQANISSVEDKLCKITESIVNLKNNLLKIRGNVCIKTLNFIMILMRILKN